MKQRSVSSLNAPDGQVKSFEFVVLDPRQPEPPKVWADSIQISPTEVNLTTQPGQNTVQMHYTVTPANCTEDIDFESTNRNVAYVSDTGVVTARNAGTATIIVEADDYVTSTATVNVSTGASTGVPATGISIAPTSAQMTVGQTLQLNATVTPANSTDAVVWSSSNSGVASVAGNGLVTANASGSAVITATAGSVSTSATITVQAPAPSPEPDVPNTPPVNPNNRLTVSPEKAYLTTIQGEGNQNSVTLTVTGQVGNLEFESSAPRVAQVSPQGVVTAISPGRATIEIEDSRDYTAYCTVIVGDGSLVSDGIVVTANNPDSFDVTVKNIAGNPAIAGSAGFTPEKVSIFTWSGYEQLDMNAKQATRIEGTNDFTYSFPVNNNEANNYYFNADNIIINAYASSTPDSDGNLVGTGVYSWINRATAPYKNVGYIAYSQNIGFDRPTVFDYDVAGTTGEGLQMEGLRVSSAVDDVHIATSLHVENIG